MRDCFKGFYNPTEDQLQAAWASEDTLFVLDTNVLLNLYGYAEQTREDFFDLLESLGEKLWIPFHVGLEYQRRRLEVIRDEKGIFNKINDNLDKIEKIFNGDFEQLALRRRFPKLQENTEKLHKDIAKSISSYKKSVSYWDEKQPCVRSHDSIREKLNDLTEGKVGEAPENQEWLEGIYSEGKERYENKIPPGYKDNSKSKSEQNTFSYNGLKYDRQYGDLILWKQLINKARDERIKNVIFVTDDSKEDWWYILESRGKKQIGPHANLQSEIYREANLDLFHMYNTSSFLESGKKILDLGVHDSSIQDANTTFLQSLSKVTRKLESDLSEKELKKRYFTEVLRSFKDYDKYRDLEFKYQFGSLEAEELQELKERINKRNELVHYITLKDLENTSRRHNKSADTEDEENGEE
ncbi:PIN-like domain-containing protein [Gilvimarinus sp. DA14]|uniref:PIN-like domain-containing protein n=1 Tax=Gilvimarinus sp. DA14 TaxID=2956798 RepID=UPI0020B77B89|nr:PIN-like domain-containing protein [Gilvimarinus sp. DA14]UTF60219.1 PIN-like domain-containing protein [Gilvimarinus sp. DA14]